MERHDLNNSTNNSTCFCFGRLSKHNKTARQYSNSDVITIQLGEIYCKCNIIIDTKALESYSQNARPLQLLMYMISPSLVPENVFLKANHEKSLIPSLPRKPQSITLTLACWFSILVHVGRDRINICRRRNRRQLHLFTNSSLAINTVRSCLVRFGLPRRSSDD